MELLIAVGLFGMILGIVYFTLASRTPIAEDAIQRRLDTIALQPRPSKPVRLEQTEAGTFWGLRIFLCLAFGFGGLVASVSSNARMSDMLLLGGAGALLGYFLPFLTGYRKARARVLEMRETLPDTLDLLVV